MPAWKGRAYLCWETGGWRLTEQMRATDGNCCLQDIIFHTPAARLLRAVDLPKGWKLVLKTNGDATLGYSSQYWTNSALLNENSDIGAVGNAKYNAFNTAPFNKVKLCVGSPNGNCVEHLVGQRYDNARSLFSAGYIRDDTFSRQDFLTTFGPPAGDYQDCPMQRPGFNIECHDGNKARWGFCLNCAGQGYLPCIYFAVCQDCNLAVASSQDQCGPREPSARTPSRHHDSWFWVELTRDPWHVRA